MSWSSVRTALTLFVARLRIHCTTRGSGTVPPVAGGRAPLLGVMAETLFMRTLPEGADEDGPVVDADDEAVEHSFDSFHCFFDLFGEDLLAAGVNHLAAPSEQDERAVGLDRGEVARERIVLAVDHAEGSSRLVGVLEIAERDVAAGSDQLPFKGDLGVAVVAAKDAARSP